MKNGKHRYDILYVVISKLYKVQAISSNEDYALGFAELVGGKKNCYIIQGHYTTLNLDDATIDRNLLFEWQNVYLTQQLEIDMVDFLELREGDMAGCMHQMMDLLSYYKFSDEEQILVDRFVETYDYYFVRDAHGLTSYDLNEELNYELLIKMYLNTVRRNNPIT